MKFKVRFVVELIFFLFVCTIAEASCIREDYHKKEQDGREKNDSLRIKSAVIVAYSNRKSRELKKVEKQHKLIAGGTSITVIKAKVQRLETLKDALRLSPGVMIQEFFGANDQPRLNIRGSGIQSNPQRRGVYLLQDGIPVNFADGSYIIGIMNPMTNDFIEVLKGANAMKYGSATLGGLLNFVSKRGDEKTSFVTKVQTGSFGYKSMALMAGGTLGTVAGGSLGKVDVFTAINGSYQKGFRLHNRNKNLAVSSNLGYSWKPNCSTRFYFNYNYLDFDIPGPLTYKMIEEDPTQIAQGVKLPLYMGPNIKRDKPKRAVHLIRLANKTTLGLAQNSNLDIYSYYQYADDRFVFPIVLSTQHSYSHDSGLKLLWQSHRAKNNLALGFISSFGSFLRDGHINKDGLDSFLFSKDRLTALNGVLYAEDKYQFSNRLLGVAAFQMAYNLRYSKDIFPNPELRPWYSHSSHKYRYFYSENITLSQNYWAINPRIGAIYNLGEKRDYQFFANASSSYEPPTFDELVGTEVTNNINTSPKKLFAVRLNKQQAFTMELGTRHQGLRLAWNIAVYSSWIKDEILEVKDFSLGIKTTKNYPYTRHNGVELGLSLVPLQRILSARDVDKIILEGVYNWSDFRFSTGKYKGKHLAGIPQHYLAGALRYEYPRQLSLELNAEWQPRDTPIDHENTVFQPSFFLLGFKLSYEGLKHFSFYVEGKNLMDRHYASSYIINDQIHKPPIPFPNFGPENMAFFIPGSLRSFYLGFTYSL